MGNEGSQPVNLGASLENDSSITWRKTEKETPFPARDGHCAAAVGNTLYVFSGLISVDGDSYETNELLTYSVENGTWTKVATKGITPPARFAATMAAVDTNLYVFGGLSQESGWFDDVHKFDTETSTWSEVSSEGTGPSPRDKLASAVIGKEIFIFGGFGPQEPEIPEEGDEEDWEDEDGPPAEQEGAQFGWFDDLFVFNTATNTWSNPMQMNLQKPTPRAAHAMCAVNTYLCVFGGRDSEARRNDIHIFNTVSRKWETIAVQGRQPDPRSYHSATTVGKRVVVLGGRGVANQHFDDFNVFDVETMQWLQPAVQGTRPAARGVHSATVVGDQLVVFGGSAEFNPGMNQCLKYFNDVHTVPTKQITTGTPKTVLNVAAGSTPGACSKQETPPEADPPAGSSAPPSTSSDSTTDSDTYAPTLPAKRQKLDSEDS